MINIDTLKQYIDFISNKEQSGNNYSPDQFNMLVSRGVDDIKRWLIGLVAEYRPNAPLPSISYDVTQKVKDDLRYLKTEKTLSVNSSGLMTIPEDYIYVTAIDYRRVINNKDTGVPDVDNVPVERIQDHKWSNRVRSTIKAPSYEFPVCVFKNKNEVEFRPKDLGKVVFTYLRDIDEPVWAYDLDDDDEVIYNASNSVNIDLPAILLNDLARIILGYMGINIREAQLVEYAEMVKNKGI